MDLGIIIAHATNDLTGHFSFSVDSTAANGFERLFVAGMQQGGRGAPTAQGFVQFRGGTFFVCYPLGSFVERDCSDSRIDLKCASKGCLVGLRLSLDGGSLGVIVYHENGLVTSKWLCGVVDGCSGGSTLGY